MLETTVIMDTKHTRAGNRLETISLGHLLAHRFRPREDLVFPWLRQGESAMLWAAPGTGKTLLTLTLAVMVAGGGSVLGWKSPKPRKVLLVDGEMAAEDLQERVTWLIDTVEGIDREAAAENLHILSRNWQKAEVAFPDLGDRAGVDGKPSGQDVVLKAARDHGAELVLLDNYSTLAEVEDENDAAAMTPTLAFLLRMKQARIGCVLVHHSGKTGTTFRGSSKLATTFEVILGLKPLEGDAGNSGAAFMLQWDKYRRERCEGVQPRIVRLVKDANGSAQWTAEATADDDLRRLVSAVELCRFVTQREIAKELGWDPAKVTTMKGRAIKATLITDAHWSLCLREAGAARIDGGDKEDF